MGWLLGFSELSIKSKPENLGRAILKIWADKVETDKKIQGVKTSRVATLLKPPKRTEFAVHETELLVHDPADLDWKWAKTGKGWYPSGGQLFEIFPVPKDTLTLNIKWRRLDPDHVLSKLEELTGSLEDLVDEGSEGRR